MTSSIAGSILLLLAGVTLVSGQSFEAASVKPHDSAFPGRSGAQGGPGASDPTRFLCRNCSLRTLLMTAYDIKGYQLLSETRSERYDVEAKVSAGISRAQFRAMLRNLLAERFHLASHHQSKEMPAWRLLIGKNGPKVTKSQATGPFPERDDLPSHADKDGFPDPAPGSGIYIFADAQNTYRLGARNVSMQRFADGLSTASSRPVYDATGLDGEYDIKLLWSPDLPGAAHRTQDGGILPADSDNDSRPTLQQALEKQLGLRLESSTGQVDVLVIDHAEKIPTAN
jgi:uncharacterized protein (TIGR03435 family)